MSLKDLKKPQLVALAGWFEVDVPENTSVADLRAILADAKVSETAVEEYDLAWAQDNFGTDESADPWVQLKFLTDEGVTASLYKKYEPKATDSEAGIITTADLDTLDTVPQVVQAKPEPAPVAAEPVLNKILLKMERDNPRFDVKGYTFRKENPFQLVSEEDAEYICRVYQGFRIALPSEAREFYN